ncbi:MAG: hypothetical protein KJ077_40210 [Anaerolineae bacterium]|nr:hypothetical protein [Anaerolineae bacterium]
MDELTPPPKIQSLLGLPLNQRGQVLLDDASTSAQPPFGTASLVVDHSHLLDGIITSGSSYSAFLSRFSWLRTSRSGGDNVVSRTTSAVGLDDTDVYHRTNISLHLSKNNGRSLPPIPRPKPVSGERIAPIRCSRPPTARIFNHSLPAMLLFIVPHLAGSAAAKLMAVTPLTVKHLGTRYQK